MSVSGLTFPEIWALDAKALAELAEDTRQLACHGYLDTQLQRARAWADSQVPAVDLAGFHLDLTDPADWQVRSKSPSSVSLRLARDLKRHLDRLNFGLPETEVNLFAPLQAHLDIHPWQDVLPSFVATFHDRWRQVPQWCEIAFPTEAEETSNDVEQSMEVAQTLFTVIWQRLLNELPEGQRLSFHVAPGMRSVEMDEDFLEWQVVNGASSGHGASPILCGRWERDPGPWPADHPLVPALNHFLQADRQSMKWLVDAAPPDGWPGGDSLLIRDHLRTHIHPAHAAAWQAHELRPSPSASASASRTVRL